MCQGTFLTVHVPGVNEILRFVVDDVDLSQWTDLRTDAQEFEAESWSLVVDPMFCSKQEKDVIKRQDVIFGQYFNASCRFENNLV